WLGEKSLRSIHGASQRWQLLGTVSIAGQFLPPKHKAGIEQIEQLVARAIGRGKAADEGELLLAVLVSHEQIERIGCVIQRGANGVYGDVSQNIVRHDVTIDAVGGMPPGGERELLDAVQAPAGLLPAIGGVGIRFWSSGHGCSWSWWCGRDSKLDVCGAGWSLDACLIFRRLRASSRAQ